MCNFVNFCRRPCYGIAIFLTGPARSSKINSFFSLKWATSSLQNRRFDSEITHVYISYNLLPIKSTVLQSPRVWASVNILHSPSSSVQPVSSIIRTSIGTLNTKKMRNSFDILVHLLIFLECIFEFMINTAPPASTSACDREKWF